ncbi:hypothetical protein K438DRAFT_1797888 [Mycena galopus ATCC 62051]|nr:hypothetical protein K438DRAFT_1797888 [Mycena galopus ATCC 62051]
MLLKTDEDLFLDHQMKTQASLLEIEALLREVAEKLAKIQSDGDILESRIAAQEARVAGVLEGGEPILVGRLQDIRVEIMVLKSELRVGGENRQVFETRRAALLRKETALRLPITLKDFRAAPIRRLPTDLILEIFMATKSKRLETVGRGTVPVLPQVCQEWRAISCDHAPLWTSFTFALFDTRRSALPWLEIYLDRSKAASLMIEVDATMRPPKSGPAARAIELVAQHSDRLYSFSLVGSHWGRIDLTGFEGRLPRLEVLRLPDLYDEAHQQFKVAPLLHSLTLQSADTPDGIPRSQVRSLHILRDLSPAGLLRFCNLHSLVCILAGAIDPTDWIVRHATLPKLTSWKIDFQGGDETDTPPNFFDYFSAPLLECLEITSLALPARISSFLQRSGSPLRRLVLQQSSVSEQELVHMCECAPDLETLVIEDGTSPTILTDGIMERLTMRPDCAALLPKLQRLVIEGDYSFSNGGLAEMIESRTANHSSNCFKSAQLVLSDRALGDGYVQRLRASEGVDISLTCRNADGDLVCVI